MGTDDVANALTVVGGPIIVVLGFRTAGRRADGLHRATKNEWVFNGVALVCFLGSAVARWAM